MSHEKQIDDLHEALASTEAELRDAREALARVEAELAEAVGLLERLSVYRPQGICAPTAIQGFAIEAAAFLSRHAQAEQQEARNAEVARESLRPENQRIEPVAPLRVPHPLEAQGAQAEPANFGQELEAFEKWRHTQADSLRRCGYPDGADAFIRLGSVQWAGWQARASLCIKNGE